jgi:AcrR family transcriptional regulator
MNTVMETRILAAAIAVIARKGLAKATLKEIAAAANAPMGFARRSFGSRGHLLEEAVRRATANLLDPQNCLQSMVDALQSRRKLPLITQWSRDSLERDSGFVVMQAVASRSGPWRETALGALQKTFAHLKPAKKGRDAEPEREALHLRLVELTGLRKRLP